MGFLEKLFGKKSESDIEGKGEKPKTKSESGSESEVEAKYSEDCSLCGGKGSEKKWAGQYWHKKCIRAAKRGAKKMI